MMDYYRVLSEEIEKYYYNNPPEWYQVYKIVYARNRSAARYHAWKHEEPHCNIKDRPKMSCHKMNVKDHDEFQEIYDAIRFDNFIDLSK